MRTTWKSFAGYHETDQLIEEGSGQILAEVKGSRWELEKGWTLFDYRTIPPNWVGRYADKKFALDAAERIVEVKK